METNLDKRCSDKGQKEGLVKPDQIKLPPIIEEIVAKSLAEKEKERENKVQLEHSKKENNQGEKNILSKNSFATLVDLPDHDIAKPGETNINKSLELSSKTHSGG